MFHCLWLYFAKFTLPSHFQFALCLMLFIAFDCFSNWFILCCSSVCYSINIHDFHNCCQQHLNIVAGTTFTQSERTNRSATGSSWRIELFEVREHEGAGYPIWLYHGIHFFAYQHMYCTSSMACLYTYRMFRIYLHVACHMHMSFFLVCMYVLYGWLHHNHW